MFRALLGGSVLTLALGAACVRAPERPSDWDEAPTATTIVVPDAGASDATPPPMGNGSLGVDFDDRYTTLATEADVARRRQALITRIWPSGALPTSLPVVTQMTADEVGAAIPANLANLDTSSVLQLDFPNLNPMPPNDTDCGTGMAYLLTPLAAARHRVMILGTGHMNTFDETEAVTGMRNVVQSLLSEGFSVLLVYMPHITPSDATGLTGPGSHDLMFADATDATSYRYFLEPSIVAVNYLASDGAPGGAFSDIAIAGLSGGSWTTTMVAALDTRLRLSIAVAAALPEFIEVSSSMDAEQFVRARLGIGYADLHLMGAVGTALGGASRRQMHVLNRRDDCCFGERQYDDHDGGAGSWQSSIRLTESNVRGALFAMGSAGRYRIEVDEMADHHMVSANILHDVLLAELDDDRKLIGAANAAGAMFYRGATGNLMRRTFPMAGSTAGSTETDTGIGIAGVATVVEGGPNAIDVFARDSQTGGGEANLVHAWLPAGAPPSGWARETLPFFSMSDPAIAAGDGTFDVVALATDGALFHASSGDQTFERVSADPFLGPPAVVRFQGTLHVFARGKDMSLYHFARAGALWVEQALPTVLSGFPAATVCGDVICVAALAPDATAHVGTIDATGAWSGWTTLNASVPLRGTPSIQATGQATGNPGIPIYVSTDHSTVGRFFQPMAGASWTFTDVPAVTTVGSPTAIQLMGGAVISGGQSGALWIHRGTTSPLGGWFD
jgi:hypothetical protein